MASSGSRAYIFSRTNQSRFCFALAKTSEGAGELPSGNSASARVTRRKLIGLLSIKARTSDSYTTSYGTHETCFAMSARGRKALNGLTFANYFLLQNLAHLGPF